MSPESGTLRNVNTYPEDEFDKLAAERDNLGAHRKPGFAHPWLVALIAIILLAPLLGWGLGKIMSQEDSSAEPSASTSQSATTSTASAETSAASPETESAEATQTTSEPEEVPTNDTPVAVLNGSGEQGLATSKAQILTDAGFTTVRAGNYTAGSPSNSTVFYKTEDAKAVAEEVAGLMGIERVSYLPEATSQENVIVVIR